MVYKLYKNKEFKQDQDFSNVQIQLLRYSCGHYRIYNRMAVDNRLFPLYTLKLTAVSSNCQLLKAKRSAVLFSRNLTAFDQSTNISFFEKRKKNIIDRKIMSYTV